MNAASLIGRDPESALVAVVGFCAAAYVGLYLGVVLGIAEVIASSADGSVQSVQLLEGMIQMLVGWVVFLALGLGTAILIRYWRSVCARCEPRSQDVGPEKEQILGYD
jgi:hypothetical protein